MANQKTSTPQSRSYIHKACDMATEVDGGEFQALADPLADMKQTYCTTCEDYFPVREFRWEDTNETLSKYYARHSQKASAIARFLGRRDGMLALCLLGAGLGVLAGIAIGLMKGFGLGILLAIILGIIGLVGGFCLQAFVVNPLLLLMICGEWDPRRLK